MAGINRQSNFQPQRFSIPSRSPLKQRVYPSVGQKTSKMTVCIAAIHGKSDDEKIIICTDSRLDFGDYGSGSSLDKTTLIGYEWFALLSGDWNAAQEFAGYISERLKSRSNPKSRAEALRFFRGVGENFLKTPFVSGATTCDLIVGGFPGGSPMLISTGVRSGSSYTHVGPDVVTVGSGAMIAQTIINLRDFQRRCDLREAVYMIYEAKRVSEKVVSVGPETWIEIHRPPITPSPASGIVNVQWPNLHLFEKLDQQYFKWCLQPIVPEELPYLPRPTGVTSPLPPSPGSSAESDEP